MSFIRFVRSLSWTGFVRSPTTVELSQSACGLLLADTAFCLVLYVIFW